MIFRNSFWVFVFIFFVFPRFSQGQDLPADNSKDTSDQQISDFSLVGYGEKGKKAWDLSGKSADIFDDVVKLKELTGNLYGAKEDVKLTADRGDFNKTTGKIHVENNVVITTSQGAKLTTDSLDWDRVNSVVSSKDVVNIKKENLFTRARGALGEPNLNKMNLERDVTVEILPQADPSKPAAPAQKVVITCDGPLEIDYQKNVAVFNNNVKVDREDSQIYSDTMDVYFGKNENKLEQKESSPGADSLFAGSKIDKIIAKGHVRTVRGENITYSEEALYNGLDNKVVLSGRPRLLIYSTGDFKGFIQQ